MSDEQELKDAIAQALEYDIYVCGRTQTAWQVGTMTQDDFTPANEDDDVINNIYEAIKPFTNQRRDMADAPMDGTSIDLYVSINGCNPFRLADCNNEGKGWVFDSGLSIDYHYKGKKVELLGWTPILEVTK